MCQGPNKEWVSQKFRGDNTHIYNFGFLGALRYKRRATRTTESLNSGRFILRLIVHCLLLHPMKHFLENIATGLIILLSKLPLRLLYILSDFAYYIVRYIVGYRRGVIQRNIAASFPEKTAKERERIISDFYHFFCDYAVETIRQLSMPASEMRRRMIFEGLDEMQQVMEQRQFAFVYLGHFCNWEWVSSLGLWAPEEWHCAQLYRPLENKMFDRIFLRLRSRFGAENIPKNAILRRIAGFKREDKKIVIGFISDQSPRRINIHDWVDFLHQDTPVFTGTERIAKSVDAAVFFADMQRKGRGRYRCRFQKMSDNVHTIPDYELTEAYMRLLEAIIRRQPAFWMWSHRRWKHQRNED